MKKLRLGTRKSALALTQSNWVREQLINLNPGLEIEMIQITTEGDRVLDRFLSEIGGKGLFVKEIEEALSRGDIDFAVHSLKDLPSAMPEGLIVACYPKRESYYDILVTSKEIKFSDLRIGATIGTSSKRRQIQLSAKRPDLKFKMLRGNIDTRLKKLMAGEYDAIILAAAGVKRLGLEVSFFSQLDIIPSVGQGTLALECRGEDAQTIEILRKLNDPDSEQSAKIERDFQAGVQGDCDLPLGALAQKKSKNEWNLKVFIADPEGNKIIFLEETSTELEKFGEQVVQKLLAKGADAILKTWKKLDD